jgi:hypothetical protein
MRVLARRLSASVVLATTLVAVAGCGSHKGAAPTSTPSQSTATGTGATPAAKTCRSEPHAGVHDPSRLKVFKPCATFAGTVVSAPDLEGGDGDITFNVRPDRGYASMMNAQNRSDGGLHIEIVPMDQPGCKPGQPIVRKGFTNMGVCSGADVMSPPLYAHVRVIGPYVHDNWSGPNEIHPAWQVELVPRS